MTNGITKFLVATALSVGAGACIDVSVDEGTSKRASSVSISGDQIRNWSRIAGSQAFGNPLRLSRILAIMHVAQHDAVNAAEPRYPTYITSLADDDADPEAAAITSAHRVLVAMFPANQAALDVQRDIALATLADGDAKTAGIALGIAVGEEVLAARANDGYTSVDPYNPTPGPGVWEPTPPAFAPLLEPQFQNVDPFVMRSRDQFRLEGPPELRSRRYANAYNEVKSVGRIDSTTRTADETAYGHWWAEPSPLSWSRIGNLVSDQLDYDLHRTARLQAVLNTSMMDAFVAGWFWKRHYSFWRPVTAIRKGDTDDNKATVADPAWLPLRATPPLPDYPSTHSLLGGTAAEVFRRLEHVDEISFCMTSITAVPAGAVRCFDSISQAEAENADSRVKNGFHFRFACDDGVKLGNKIGKHAARQFDHH